LNVVLVARCKAALDALAADLSAKHGVEARVIAADLATDEGIRSVADGTEGLDAGLLVTAAGYGVSGPFLATPVDAHLGMLDVNCRAVVTLAAEFGRRFTVRGRGGVVFFGSIVGFQGVPWAAHYSATKAYVQSLAEALAVEFRPAGVDVLSAAPGPTDSGFASRADMRIGRAMRPDDVAAVALAALGRRTTVLPGLLTKVLTYSLVPLPRWARVRIMGQVMRGMTKHQQHARDRNEV
jgi:uncharacterized protein